MSIPPDQFAAIDDTLSRLATESILAEIGRDGGLLPAYSLLGELQELCGGEPTLLSRIAATRAVLEARLDAAQPFDAGSLESLRALVKAMPDELTRWRAGRLVSPALPAEPAPDGQSKEAVQPGVGEGDQVMRIDLAGNQELLAEFHAETVDHLHQIEVALLTLEQRQNDRDALDSIFRSFHTIKGNAGFLGLVPMHTLAHEVESLLDRARQGQLRLTPPIITEILHSRDALQSLAQQVAGVLHKGETPARIVPVGRLIAKLKRLAEGEPAEETPTAAAASCPPTMDRENSFVTPPSPVEAVAPLDVAPSRPGSTLAVGARAAAGTIRVSTEKLDALMDVVGELVIVQSQLIESTRHTGVDHSALQRNVAQLGRITRELQTTAMSLRMIPLKPTFQKMERLVRDLARDFGKKVTFVASGEDTELDRSLIEEIADPLVHMVRNALDHGLESPADRLAAGKPAAGTLQLRAYHQGGTVVLELQDDGRGIDPEKVRRKAVEKGIVAATSILSRDETLALIFAPGFSTADQVTAVSGRGVGMDVVKRNIERLRGRIEIASEVGRGASFRIKLPLTTAIIDGLVVRVGGDRFILPSGAVQVALRPARGDVSRVQGCGEVLDFRGRLVPIHRLCRRLGIAGDAENPWDGIVVIVENSGRTSGLLVDEMMAKQEIVIKNLGAFMQNLPGVAGGAILGDGNIALILDPGSLLEAA